MRDLQREKVWAVCHGPTQRFVVPSRKREQPPVPPQQEEEQKPLPTPPKRKPRQPPVPQQDEQRQLLPAPQQDEQQEPPKSDTDSPEPAQPLPLYDDAGDDNLVTYEDAAALAQYLHWKAGEPFPPRHAVALSLDAAGLISIALLHAYDDRHGICDGASTWAAAIDSYTELCPRDPDDDNGRLSVRIICKGQLPAGAKLPPRVRLQDRGFLTITRQRISSRPSWQPDAGGVVRDATEALANLCSERQPSYVRL